MNKYEIKSAYDKITLSEDFKREAKEKLLAIANGDRSAAVPVGDDYGRAVEIKVPERRKNPAKTIAGIVSAAAVLAVCVLGGGYLIRKHGADIITPPNSTVIDRQWTDRDTAYEICHGDNEKPYSEEFARELSEGGKAFHERNLEDMREHGASDDIEANPDNFRVSAYVSYAFPSGDDYFLVKEYSFVQDLDAGYFEIYFLRNGKTKLLGEFDYDYNTLISDGEYLYYTYNGYVSRVSPEGDIENILELTENDTENNGGAITFNYYSSKMFVSASGNGDYLTLSNVYYENADGGGFMYNYTINVASLEAVGERVIAQGAMPAPFANPDTEEYFYFYNPLTAISTDIPEELTDGIPQEELDAYYNSFDIVNAPSDNIMGYPNIYSFIRCFDVTDEFNIYFGLDEYKKYMLGDSMEDAGNYFNNGCSIVVGDKIYSPNWVYLHSVEDWKQAGLIENGLASMAEIIYCDFPFEEDARIAFEAKLEEALGYHVSLEYRFGEETEENTEPPEITYDDIATIDENGNFLLSCRTGSANINLQPLEATPAPERGESSFKSFEDPVVAATEAIDRSKYHGIVLVGQVGEGEYVYPLEDTYGVDMGVTAQFDPRVMPSYYLEAESSIYSDELVSLHYTDRADGELYINITARDYNSKLERYVTDGGGNIYMGIPTDKINTYVLSESDFQNHDFTNSYGAFSFMYIGGKQVDGENYFYAYRKSGDLPEDFTLTLSAKGCSLDDFLDLVAAVVQYNPQFSDFNGFSLSNGMLPEYSEPKTVETEQGTLVLNQGKYLGTGAGFNYDVNSAVPREETGALYTEEDMTAFTGNSALFELPLGFEPAETKVSYFANYAEFRDGYNIQLFHEGRPLLGEAETDEDFIEAKKYFRDGYCYSYDKLPYFEDKTPMVQVYDADFSDGDHLVTVQAFKGDFGQRYMGFGFQFLPAEPSNLCEDYYNDYVYEQGNGENSLSRIFAASYSDYQDDYYGGFTKNGTIYVVTADNIDEQAFADILAALYQG